MNRAYRRKLPPEVRAVLDQARCPDCDSEADITEPIPGYHQLNIRHDDTCPWFAAYQKEHA